MTKRRREEVVYRVARTKSELEQAFSLVYKEYANRGYIPKGYKSKLRLSLYNALPSTTTFVAMKGKMVVASVTLIPSTRLGVPMDKIYKKELDRLRRKKRRIAECSQFAIDNTLFPQGWFSMFNFAKFIFIYKLFRLVTSYASKVDGLTDLCIAINPKHQHLYNFMAFKKLAGLKYYGSVNKAPAIAKRLNLKTFEKEIKHRKALHLIFFGYKADPSVYRGKYKLSSSDLDYFFVKKSDIFKKAKKRDVDYIKKITPRK